MSDLSAFRTAVLIVQCRESRAAKARKGGVDAFGETSAGPCGRFAVRASHSADLTLSAQAHFQSEAALCQTKRNTLPGEGRERRILLSISINLDKNYFDKINKNKNCVYFGERPLNYDIIVQFFDREWWRGKRQVDLSEDAIVRELIVKVQAAVSPKPLNPPSNA